MPVLVQSLEPLGVNAQVCVLECGWGCQRGLCCCWSAVPLPSPGGQCGESGRTSCVPPPQFSAAGTALAPSPCASQDAVPPACLPGSEDHNNNHLINTKPSTASSPGLPTLTTRVVLTSALGLAPSGAVRSSSLNWVILALWKLSLSCSPYLARRMPAVQESAVASSSQQSTLMSFWFGTN